MFHRWDWRLISDSFDGGGKEYASREYDALHGEPVRCEHVRLVRLGSRRDSQRANGPGWGAPRCSGYRSRVERRGSLRGDRYLSP